MKLKLLSDVFYLFFNLDEIHRVFCGFLEILILGLQRNSFSFKDV